MISATGTSVFLVGAKTKGGYDGSIWLHPDGLSWPHPGWGWVTGSVWRLQLAPVPVLRVGCLCCYVASRRIPWQDLGTFGGSISQGNAINAQGQVTGIANTADGNTHVFLWTP